MSMPFLLMISPSRLTRMARSRRSLRMARSLRTTRSRVPLLCSSISAMRFFRAMHLILYAASTEGGSAEGAVADAAIEGGEQSAREIQTMENDDG